MIFRLLCCVYLKLWKCIAERHTQAKTTLQISDSCIFAYVVLWCLGTILYMQNSFTSANKYPQYTHTQTNNEGTCRCNTTNSIVKSNKYTTEWKYNKYIWIPVEHKDLHLHIHSRSISSGLTPVGMRNRSESERERGWKLWKLHTVHFVHVCVTLCVLDSFDVC